VKGKEKRRIRFEIVGVVDLWFTGKGGTPARRSKVITNAKIPTESYIQRKEES